MKWTTLYAYQVDQFMAKDQIDHFMKASTGKVTENCFYKNIKNVSVNKSIISATFFLLVGWD
jgi:hypothetical protein